MQKKPMIGVIVGRVYESVQKVMLEGIIAQAEKYNFDTAIISNIHNASYMEYFAFVEVENKIVGFINVGESDEKEYSNCTVYFVGGLFQNGGRNPFVASKRRGRNPLRRYGRRVRQQYYVRY